MIGVRLLRVVVAGQRHGLRGTVDAGVAGIAHIGIELRSAVVPPPMLGAMRRDAEVQAVLARSFF